MKTPEELQSQRIKALEELEPGSKVKISLYLHLTIQKEPDGSWKMEKVFLPTELASPTSRYLSLYYPVVIG